MAIQQSRLSPAGLKSSLPMSEAASTSVQEGRIAIDQVLESPASNKSSKVAVMIGPCSIHDTAAAMDYAVRLAAMAEKHRSELVIAMRVYVEKPRTTVGWKGLMHDPFLTQGKESNLAEGLYQSREIMLRVAELGLPVVTELLSPFALPFFEDVLSCGVIGARTTESQTHRELASDTPLAIGFKNATDGTFGPALDAMKAADHQHTLVGIDEHGQIEQRVSPGNSKTFVILRGGKSGPNFSAEHVRQAETAMVAAGRPANIVVDCSHANSMKDYRKQSQVAGNVAQQIASGAPITGLMLESNINPGRQDIGPDGAAGLEYGVSVTDGCIDWQETERVLNTLATAVRIRRGSESAAAAAPFGLLKQDRRRSSAVKPIEKLERSVFAPAVACV